MQNKLEWINLGLMYSNLKINILNLIFTCKMSCKRSKHVKLIFNHLELFQQVSNDSTKLFKWSFGLKNKKIKKSTLETSNFLENTYLNGQICVWMHFKPFKPFRKVLYHNFKLSKWFLCPEFLKSKIWHCNLLESLKTCI